MIARRVGFSLLITLMALTLAACGSPNSEASLPARSLSVELTEFSIAPNVLVAQVGEPLTFNIANKGVLDHDVTIVDSEGQKLTHVEVKHGHSATFDFRPSASGELRILCSIDGHAKAGMTAQLIVSP